MTPFSFFWAVFQATLLSTGGTGNLPAIHDKLVGVRGGVTEAQIAEALALGQVCPGPNGLWVVCLGYLWGGVMGALLAVVAVVLPPLLIVPIERLYRRVSGHKAVDGFVAGLGLAVVGIGCVILCQVFAGSGSVSITRVLIAAGAAGLMASRRVPFLLILILAAIAGLLLG